MSSSRSAVKVVVRFRSTARFTQHNIQIDSDNNKITLIAEDDSSHGESKDGLNNKTNTFRFRYDSVLHNAGQNTVYETYANSVVMGCLDGLNGTIFSYGQTGAGKTFTMVGDTKVYAHRGVMPRALAHIFQEIESREAEYKYTVKVSYMEIYKERMFDLLRDGKQERQQLTIVEDTKGGKGVHVRGLTTVKVEDEAGALELLFQGEDLKTTAKHSLNDRSNRSHSVYTIYIEQQARLDSSGKKRVSKLNLVDLAGSERDKKVGLDSSEGGDNSLKDESNYINKSLTFLEQCVVALTNRGRSHVPYRSTKLTYVLKDSLGGNCNTLMYCCVYGVSDHLEETVSSLRLAARMRHVKNESVANMQQDATAYTRNLERQVAHLKQELRMHDALAGKAGETYAEYTPEQRMEIQHQVKEYLAAPLETEDSIITVRSLRHVMEVFKQFKVIVNNMKSEAVEQAKDELTKSGFVAAADDTGAADSGAAAGGDGAGADSAADPGQGQDGEGVGEVESGDTGLGIAPSDARPEIESKEEASDSSETVVPAVEDASGAASAAVPVAQTESPPEHKSQKEAFEEFKAMEGRSLNDSLSVVKAKLKEAVVAKKNARNEIVEILQPRLQDIKAKLETYKKSEMSKTLSQDGTPIMDNEQFQLLSEKKSVIKRLRDQRDLHASLKSDIDGYKTQKTEMLEKLVAAFNGWYDKKYGDALPVGDMADQLDEEEKFELLERQKILDTDPESLAYFQAAKAARKHHLKMGSSNKREVQRKRLGK